MTAASPGADVSVSCLVVTRPGRLDRLVTAIACFEHQTHPRRELVVVHDGDRSFDADVRAVCAGGVSGAPVTVHRSPRRRLGTLRNTSVEVASGEVVCQWDDDDLHHPRRIAEQLDHMLAVDAAACLLTDQLHLFESTGELAWDDWTVEPFPMSLIPGTLLARVATLGRYPRRRRGEDTAVVTGLVADRRRVRGLQDAGWLYVYVSHGANAFSDAHHRAISAAKHRGSRIDDDDLDTLTATLREYPVDPRRVSIATGDRVHELTLGAP